MNTQLHKQEWRNRTPEDIEKWGEGPWQDEPDKVQWVDEATNLDCLIVRNHRGALCGYVGVPKSHPCFQKGYDDVEAAVHGGLTFAGPCAHSKDPSQGICHIPAEGRTDDIWWLGFDCVHGGDLAPGLNFGHNRFDEYRDMEYVTSQCTNLARQLAESK